MPARSENLSVTAILGELSFSILTDDGGGRLLQRTGHPADVGSTWEPGPYEGRRWGDVTIVMLDRVYRAAPHLPRYLGHYRITTLLRRLMSPGVSVMDHGCLVQLDPGLARLSRQEAGMHDQSIQFEVPLLALDTCVRRHKMENVIFEEATADTSAGTPTAIRELPLREGFTLGGAAGEPWNGGSTPGNKLWPRRTASRGMR